MRREPRPTPRGRGGCPPPAPVIVLARPLPAQLVDDEGHLVGVSGGGMVTATPARLSVDGGAVGGGDRVGRAVAIGRTVVVGPPAPGPDAGRHRCRDRTSAHARAGRLVAGGDLRLNPPGAMPSCTAIPTSASSTVPRTPRSWWPRPPGSGSGPWPSPTTTVCTAWSASPRRPGRVGLASVFGAELTLVPSGRATPGARTGVPDPVGTHLVVLARDPDGYARLSRAIAEAHLAGGTKGRPTCTLDDLGDRHGGHWLVLTGCRKGAVPAALTTAGPAAAGRELDRLTEAFGRENVAVELWAHGDPLDTARNDALARLAVDRGVDLVATNNVHYATASRRPLATALAAVRARRPLVELEGWLPAAAAAHLRSPGEQERRFARWPGAVTRAGELGRECAFDLRLVAPRLPHFPVPPGHDEQTWLVELTRRGATARYGPRQDERIPGAWAQIDHELEVIGALGFAGYFLIVWDIVEFCRRHDIYCQGRGSAANSAVCFALSITRADAVGLGLLFERFLSPERDGPPDIDLDIESGRREEVIAYVFEHYGRHHAAQVANVITYRARSAIRDIGKALGHSPEQVDGWAKGVDNGEPLDRGGPLPPAVADLAGQVLDFPRHLGLHSGGMVICDRPVVEVCPVEWARHPGTDRPAVGQGRLRHGGPGQVRPARAGDARRPAPGGGPDPRRPRGGHRPGHGAPGGRRLRHAVPGRHRGGVPGGEPGPDGHAPPDPAPVLFRPGDRGGHHPPRSHPGGVRPPLHPASAGPRGAHRPAPPAREGPGQDTGGAAVPGAAHADRHRRRRVQRGGGRRAAPGHGGQALRGPDDPPARPPLRRDGRAGDHRRRRRRDRRQAGRLRQLRVPREPRRVLRLPRLLERLVEAPLPRRLLRRAAQRPAHGVLVPPVPGGRRPPARDRRAPSPRRPVGRRGHPRLGGGRAPPVVRWAHRAASRTSAWGSGRCGPWAPRWPSASAAHRPYASMEDLVRRGGVGRSQLEALATAGALEGLAPRDGTAAPHDATGGRPGARRCGPPGWWPRPRPTGCPAS